jgi:hypothetical protein
MEHLLISNARHIRFANAVGIQKIMRNMLAMQQNMKTITDASQDADFERAKIYYSLFSMTPHVSGLSSTQIAILTLLRKCWHPSEEGLNSPLKNTSPCSTSSVVLIKHWVNEVH